MNRIDGSSGCRTYISQSLHRFKNALVQSTWRIKRSLAAAASVNISRTDSIQTTGGNVLSKSKPGRFRSTDVLQYVCPQLMFVMPLRYLNLRFNYGLMSVKIPYTLEFVLVLKWRSKYPFYTSESKT